MVDEVVVTRGEYLAEETATKKIFYFRDPVLKIDVKSREVYKKSNKVIHFPFGKKGEPKYNKIREIEYKGLPSPLPRGIYKDPTYGYGFTKTLSPLLYGLEDQFNFKKVVVTLKGSVEVKSNTLHLGYDTLNRFYPKMETLLSTHKDQKDVLVCDFLNYYYPKKFKKGKVKYIKGTMHSLISSQIKDDTQLSKEDYESILVLVASNAENEEIISKKTILETREKIEKRFLEDAIEEFEALLAQKTATGKLEDKWEDLFKRNSWIISNLFSLPVFLFANQAYVGGKEIFNANGKITDFLFKNSLTDNLTIIEIKTHKTPLLSKSPYRGKDVYSIDEELSGAVNQVLDQKQNLQNEFHTLRSKAGKDGEWFESYNSKCLVIAGHTDDLPSEGKKSFEIFRNNLHGVEIITFNEVLKKMQAFVSLLKKK
jgi:hypothetical protein